MDHRKFVAAQPRHHVGIAEATAQPARNRFQQFVADRMSERVVDAFELVDVDVHHGELLAGPHRLQRVLELFAKQHPVGQVGQRIVVREVGDLFFGARAFRDVLDHRNPSADVERLVDDLDRPAAGSLGDLVGDFSKCNIADDLGAELLDIAVERSGLLAVCDQVLHGAAWLGHLRRQTEHVDVAPVANRDPRRRIVEDEALRNIVHGGVEPLLLERQLLLRQSMLLRQLANDEQQYDGNHQHREVRQPRSEIGSAPASPPAPPIPSSWR